MTEQQNVVLSPDTFKDLPYSLNKIERFSEDRGLASFLNQVEHILRVYPRTDLLQQNRIFQNIRHQIIGDAQMLVNRHQPNTWSALRQLLIENYNSCTPLPTLIDRITKAQYRASIRKLEDYLKKYII